MDQLSGPPGARAPLRAVAQSELPLGEKGPEQRSDPPRQGGTRRLCFRILGACGCVPWRGATAQLCTPSSRGAWRWLCGSSWETRRGRGLAAERDPGVRWGQAVGPSVLVSLVLNPPPSTIRGLFEPHVAVALLGSLVLITTPSPMGEHSRCWRGPVARAVHLLTGAASGRCWPLRSLALGSLRMSGGKGQPPPGAPR